MFRVILPRRFPSKCQVLVGKYGGFEFRVQV